MEEEHEEGGCVRRGSAAHCCNCVSPVVIFIYFFSAGQACTSLFRCVSHLLAVAKGLPAVRNTLLLRVPARRHEYDVSAAAQCVKWRTGPRERRVISSSSSPRERPGRAPLGIKKKILFIIRDHQHSPRPGLPFFFSECVFHVLVVSITKPPTHLEKIHPWRPI